MAPTTTTTSGPTTTVTGPYELYCPGTPVGNVVLNGAETVGTLSPADPTSGSTFQLTGYQTTVNLPSGLAGAAAALGSTINGSADATIDASGATPAKTPENNLSFNVPIPSTIPSAGIPLTVPATPATASFTATSDKITIQEDSAASLTVNVAGAPLTFTCTSYPNNTVESATGITTSAPTAAPIAPVIALAGGGSTTTTTPPATTTTSGGGGSTTTSPNSSPSTTAGVVTSPASNLAFTGPGPGIGLLGILGGILIVLGFALFLLVDAPRRAFGRLAFVGPEAWKRLRGFEWHRPGDPGTAGDGARPGSPGSRLSHTASAITRSGAGLARSGGSAVVHGGTHLARSVPDRARHGARSGWHVAKRTGSWLLGR
ncbi:MAG TPA: hypothetical protein VMB72_06085 [Acidimicrobiales bacterium]|nr:hypothetical protein [Acidimicrobiales bacterium]